MAPAQKAKRYGDANFVEKFVSPPGSRPLPLYMRVAGPRIPVREKVHSCEKAWEIGHPTLGIG